MANLAAGCFRKRAGSQQSDRMELDAMNVCDGLANRAYEIEDGARALTLVQEKRRSDEFQRIGPGDLQASRIKFSSNRDALVVFLEGEYGGAPWTDSRVLALNRQLEILRVVFEPADDQEVFQSSRNKQLAVDERAEVTRAQVRSTSIVSEHGDKRLRGLLLAAPVTFCNALR